VIDVSKYPGHTLVAWFQSKVKCGRGGRWVDVRPNWKEKPRMPEGLEIATRWESLT
jgi:hypothetical protein